MDFRACAVLAFSPLAILSSAGHAQIAPANHEPLIQAQANAVLVDVVVTDRGGKLVHGLTRQDFQISEDGKPQVIDFFEERTSAAASPVALSHLPPHVFTNQPAAPDSGAVNVLLLDILNTSPQNLESVRTQTVNFLRTVPPGTQVAVYTLSTRLSLLQGFTSNPDLLRAALEGKRADAVKTVDSRTREDDLLDKEEVSMVPGVQGASARAGDARSLAAFANQQAGDRASITLAALEDLARSLAAIPGRKNVIWFASRFPVSVFPNGRERQRLSNGAEIPDEERQAVRLLTEARVALYPVSAQGILIDRTLNADSSGQPNGDDFEADRIQQTAVNGANSATMEQLAKDTGGIAQYTSNDLAKSTRQAIQNGSDYYTLAYAPANEKMDGEFRRIEVKLGQRGYKLEYRRGYFAAAPAQAAGETPGDPLSKLLAAHAPAATQVVYQAELVRPNPQPSAGGTRIGGNARLAGPATRYRCDFSIPVSSLDLSPASDGTRSADVELALVAYGADGSAVNWSSSRFSLKLNAASYQAAQQSGVSLHMELDIPPAGTTLATGVYDLATARAGTLQLPLSVAVSSTPAPASAVAEPAAVPAPIAPPAGPPADDTRQPALRHRAASTAATSGAKERRFHLDVAVDDAQGNAVTGLQPWDFKLLDNGRPDKILFFQAFDGVSVKPDPPVEVILLFDELNQSPQQTAFARDQVAQFLRQNGGHLAYPVSFMLLTDAGLRVQPEPSLDGNAIAGLLKGVGANVSAFNASMGSEGSLERVGRSLHQLDNIAINQVNKPGRKLLIWIGPGWPMLDANRFVYTDKARRENFALTVELTNQLREARMVVNSVSLVSPENTANSGRDVLYQAFLGGVQSARDADSGHLGLRVLAYQTGGRILGPDNDLVSQMNQCIADADAFYRIAFDPPDAAHADEYHRLAVQVTKPGLTVRTTSGYYDEPPGN